MSSSWFGSSISVKIAFVNGTFKNLGNGGNALKLNCRLWLRVFEVGKHAIEKNILFPSICYGRRKVSGNKKKLLTSFVFSLQWVWVGLRWRHHCDPVRTKRIQAGSREMPGWIQTRFSIGNWRCLATCFFFMILDSTRNKNPATKSKKAATKAKPKDLRLNRSFSI